MHNPRLAPITVGALPEGSLVPTDSPLVPRPQFEDPISIQNTGRFPRLQQWLGWTAARVTHHPYLTQEPLREVHRQLFVAGEGRFEEEEIAFAAIHGPLTEDAFKSLSSWTGRLNGHFDQRLWNHYSWGLAAHRKGQLKSAVQFLNIFTEDYVAASPLRVLGLVAKAQAHLDWGVRREGQFREEAYAQAHRIFSEILPDVLEQLRGELSVELTGVLSELYFRAAQVFWEDGYTVEALNVAGHLVNQFPGSEPAQIVVSDESPYLDFLKRDVDVTTVELDGVSWTRRAMAGFKEFLAQAHFPEPTLAWLTSLAGGAGLTAAVSVLTGGVSYAEALPLMGVGALGAFAGIRTLIGLSAPETRRAWRTGWSDRSGWSSFKTAAGQLAKLAGVYLAAGGVVPGAEVFGEWLTTMPDANGWASFRGPGTVPAYLVSAWDHYARAMVDMVSTSGLDGLAEWWGYFKESVFGQTVSNWVEHFVLDFPSVVQGIYENGVTHSPFGALPTAVKAPLYTYLGLCGALSFMTLFFGPQYSGLEKKYPWLYTVERLSIPGAVLLSMGAGMATNSDAGWLSALFIVGGGYLITYLKHLQMGQPYNPLTMDFPSAFRMTLGPYLFILPGLIAQEGVEVNNGLDLVMKTAGQAPLMLAIGMIQAWMGGFNLEQMTWSKALKYFTWKLPINLFRVHRGWGEGLYVIYEYIYNHILVGAGITNAKPEPVGSPAQYRPFVSSIREYARLRDEGKAEAGMARSASIASGVIEAARVWDYFSPIVARTSMELFPPPFALASSVARSKNPGFPTYASPLYFQLTLLRYLQDEGVGAESIEAFLEIVHDFVVRGLVAPEDRSDVFHNLLVTIHMAKDGPYAEQIASWLDENMWMERLYGVDPETPAHDWQSAEARLYLSEALRDSEASSDGLIRYNHQHGLSFHKFGDWMHASLPDWFFKGLRLARVNI